MVYAQGAKLTWAETGSKQVSVIGSEEKRAFTAVVSIANDGTMLPIQAVYGGRSVQSCPSPAAPYYKEAINEGFRFVYSGTDTYWSNQRTMRLFVDDILAMYFDNAKRRLGIPLSHRSLWQIDVWTVHRSAEFRDWMWKTHPSIMMDYVPAGCTGLWQPDDVGIQRVLKHSMKRSYHEDIVKEVLAKLESDAALVLEKRLAVLRDRSVGWLWHAYQLFMSKPEIVRKVNSFTCFPRPPI